MLKIELRAYRQYDQFYLQVRTQYKSWLFKRVTWTSWEDVKSSTADPRFNDIYSFKSLDELRQRKDELFIRHMREHAITEKIKL